MTTDQKKKYEEAIKSITPTIEIIEHAYSEGFDACLKMIEEERNLLENTGSLMWHKPDEQNKTLQVAECLSVTLKYINELQKLRK